MTPETANTGDNRTSQQEETPRIYAACLAAYNNGRLHGRWIDATQEPDDIQAEISEMLAASPITDAEEWAIHDYEGFEGARLEGYSGIEKAHALALFIVEISFNLDRTREHVDSVARLAVNAVIGVFLGVFETDRDAGQRPALAVGIIFNLVFFNFTHAKIIT